jgi:hypothetical protein
MAYHEHVVLLEVPLSDIGAGHTRHDADRSHTRDAVAQSERDGAVSSAQTHADLLIFTHSSAPTAALAAPASPEETSDV